jgi:small nuclear ribonucleoprotein (snRNP)-like protein
MLLPNTNSCAIVFGIACFSLLLLCYYIISFQAFDQHLNMILGNVEEIVTTTEVDTETDEEIVKKVTRQVGMLFVRGDIVVLVSPPLRTGKSTAVVTTKGK